jgi:hypothetical protein
VTANGGRFDPGGWTMTMSVDNVGVWAYAIMHADRAEERVGGLRGVAGEPVRVVSADGLAAAVGTVGLGEFGQDALRRNLEDLDWLAAKARAHDAVVSGIARFGPVIPVRMATLYLDDRRVEQLLADRHAAFDAALHRVSGREELGVKAYADPTGLLPADEEPQVRHCLLAASAPRARVTGGSASAGGCGGRVHSRHADEMRRGRQAQARSGSKFVGHGCLDGTERNVSGRRGNGTAVS